MFQVKNHSNNHFTGWYRTKTDVPVLEIGGVNWLRGRPIGLDTHAIDVYLDLGPQESVDVDLSSPVTLQDLPDRPVWPRDILGFFGGMPMINLTPMLLVSLQVDGAAVRAHFRTRVYEMLVIDVWFRWYPGQVWVEGEYQCTASNPGSQLMGIRAPAISLTFGCGFLSAAGRSDNLLLDVGQYMADGRARSVPFSILFTEQVRTTSQFSSFSALGALGLAGHGVENIWSDGNGRTDPDFKPAKFAAQNADAANRLHNERLPLLGPSIRSEDTGKQEDQLFHVGAEGSGLEIPRYLAALKLNSERPCNHKEADGSPLNPDLHPDLLMWNCRPDKRISSDMLGKPRELASDGAETAGRSGPDTQHFLTQTLFASIRVKDSPALQQLASNLATNYLFMRTVQRGWSTSATYSAREWLYEPLFAVHCHRNLEDRQLAARVVERCKQRIERLLLPAMEGKHHLYVFEDTPSLGSGKWVIGWQEAAGSYGLDLFAEVFNMPKLGEVALRVAREVFSRGWSLVDSTWLSRAQYPIDGQPLPDADGSFNDYGMPLALRVIARHDPMNAVVLEVLDQLKTAGAYRWVLPSWFPN